MTSAASTSEAPVVHVRDLEYSFSEGAPPALTGIDLDLAAGEFAIMTGPSGSGKTTLLSLIGSLRHHQKGTLHVLGRDLARLDGPALERHRQQLGFIFQLHNLFPSLTAYQSVQMALDLAEVDDAERDRRIRALLAHLGLGERMDYKPDSLSGGQRQRVAVARALIHRPRLILADEPTAALDQANTQLVLDLFHYMSIVEGTTVLMVTQDSRVFEVANRMINLVDGRIESDSRGPRA